MNCLVYVLAMPYLAQNSFLCCSFSTSGNSKFAFDLALWTFKQNGVLRVVGVEHHRIGEDMPPAAYTIEDKVVCVYHL